MPFLCAFLGGIFISDKSCNEFNGIYAELAEIMNDKIVEQIYRHYKGQQVSFPMRLYSKAYIKEKILTEFNGKNYRELAQKYEYSERWVREIVKK